MSCSACQIGPIVSYWFHLRLAVEAVAPNCLCFLWAVCRCVWSSNFIVFRGRIGGYAEGEVPADASELCGRLLTTVYMGTANSSAETRARAASLAAQLGADHVDMRIDAVVDALVGLFAAVTGRRPAFRVGRPGFEAVWLRRCLVYSTAHQPNN
jgi:hypothetical protein